MRNWTRDSRTRRVWLLHNLPPAARTNTTRHTSERSQRGSENTGEVDPHPRFTWCLTARNHHHLIYASNRSPSTPFRSSLPIFHNAQLSSIPSQSIQLKFSQNPMRSWSTTTTVNSTPHLDFHLFTDPAIIGLRQTAADLTVDKQLLVIWVPSQQPGETRFFNNPAISPNSRCLKDTINAVQPPWTSTTVGSLHTWPRRKARIRNDQSWHHRPYLFSKWSSPILRRWQHLTCRTEETQCRLCGEEGETAEHLWLLCPALQVDHYHHPPCDELVHLQHACPRAPEDHPQVPAFPWSITAAYIY